jgi:hypothetical protein
MKVTMTDFYPDSRALIVPTALRQGLIADPNAVGRVIRRDEAAAGQLNTVALASAGCSIAAAAGVLATAGVTAPLIFPVVMIGAGVLTWWNSRACQRDRQAEGEFIAAHPEIIELVNRKADEGQPLERIADAYENAYQLFLWGESPVIALPESAESTPMPLPAPAVGTQDQLRAIPVQAVSVPEATPEVHRILANPPSEGPVAVLLANPYQNRLIFGGQRTGKSYLAAVATRHLAARGIKIFHLNLSHTLTSEGRDEDLEYWQHATESIRFDLGLLDPDSADRLISEAICMIKRFWAQTGAILVVDEAPAQVAAANLHADLLEPLNAAIAAFSSQCNSTGVKRGKSVWAIGPEFIAANMLQAGKSFCKTGKLTHVFIHPESQADWNGQRLTFDSGLYQQLQANFRSEILEPAAAPKCIRAIQIEGRFGSLDGLVMPPWAAPPAPEMYQSTEIEHSRYSEIIARLTSHGTGDALLVANFLGWIRSKQGEKVSLRKVQGSWGKSNDCRDRESLSQVFAVATAQKFLTRIDDDTYQILRIED